MGLWRALAFHFKDKAAVAACKVINEPQTSAPRGRLRDANEPGWDEINGLYQRVLPASVPAAVRR